MLTLSGSGFLTTTSVVVGNARPVYTVVSDTQLRIIAPPASAALSGQDGGWVPVTVDTLWGQSATTLIAHYTFSPSPPSTEAIEWQFVGDGRLTGAPVTAGNYVYMASTAGNVYALDARTGSLTSQSSTGTSIDLSWDFLPNTGIGIGSGYLFVPGNGTITAFSVS